MRSFWLLLWWGWAWRLSLRSVLAALGATALACAGIYLLKGMPEADEAVSGALRTIALLLFLPLWAAAFLGFFVTSVRELFNRCAGGFELRLIGCDGEELSGTPTTRETLKIWRKWLFAIIWATAAEGIVFAAAAWVAGLSEWFSMPLLYVMVMLAALATLPLMGSRCKQVKVRRC